MATEGNVKTLYGDKEQTQAIFPRTKVSAVSDDEGNGLDAILDELKKSVSDGKYLVASAITEKGVTTNPAASFDMMATNISNIVTEDKTILYENGVWKSGSSITTKTTVTEGTEDITIGNGTTEGALTFTIPNGHIGKRINVEFTLPVTVPYDTSGTYAYWLSIGYMAMFRTYSSAGAVLNYMNALSISTAGKAMKKTISMGITEANMKFGIQANQNTKVVLSKVWIEGDCELPDDLEVGAKWAGSSSYSSNYYSDDDSSNRYQVTNLTTGVTTGTGISKSGDTIVLSERASKLKLTGNLRSGCEQIDGAATYALMYLENVSTGVAYCTTNTVSWIGNTSYEEPMTMTATSNNVPAGTYKIMLMLTFAGNGNDTLWCGQYDSKWEVIIVEVTA